MKLIIYLREESYFLLLKKGVVHTEGILGSERSPEDLCKEYAISAVRILISRSKTFLRTVSFPFSSPSKISLVLEEELRSLFPLPLDQLTVRWHLKSRKKDSATILVSAWEKSFLDPWESLQKTYRFSLSIGCEQDFLFNLFRSSGHTSYDVIFFDSRYLSLISVRKGILSMASSSFTEDFSFSPETLFPEGTSGPLYYVGPSSLLPKKELIPSPILLDVASLSRQSRIFDLLTAYPAISTSSGFRTFSLRSRTLIINPFMVALSFLYLAFLLILLRPLFLLPSAKKEASLASLKVEETFRRYFPPVSRLVNPVSQAEEKVRGFHQEKGTLVSSLSPLEIMRAITDAIPETVPFRVSRLTLHGTTLFLACDTHSLADVEKSASLLRKSSLFQGVKVSQISFGPEAVTFTVVMDILHDTE
ncbi:MAG: hypothetical protein WDA18_01325 [Candidatus Ratteibacteria bacterium]